MDGGAGNDTLTGGGAPDRFDFSTLLDNSSNVDTITDFVSAVDRFGLDLGVFSALGSPGRLTAGAFAQGVGTTQGQDADDRIVYDISTGALYFDADGAGSAAAVRFAILGVSTHPALAFSDFDLV